MIHFKVKQSPTLKTIFKPFANTNHSDKTFIEISHMNPYFPNLC